MQNKGSTLLDLEKQPYQLSRLINRQQLKVQNLELQ